jgi:hypothetical protein
MTREEATRLAKELFDFFDAEPGSLYIRIEEKHNRLVVRLSGAKLDWQPKTYGGLDVVYEG